MDAKSLQERKSPSMQIYSLPQKDPLTQKNSLKSIPTVQGTPIFNIICHQLISYFLQKKDLLDSKVKLIFNLHGPLFSSFAKESLNNNIDRVLEAEFIRQVLSSSRRLSQIKKVFWSPPCRQCEPQDICILSY